MQLLLNSNKNVHNHCDFKQRSYMRQLLSLATRQHDHLCMKIACATFYKSLGNRPPIIFKYLQATCRNNMRYFMRATCTNDHVALSTVTKLPHVWPALTVKNYTLDSYVPITTQLSTVRLKHSCYNNHKSRC